MKEFEKMNRRDFFKKSLAVSAGALGSFFFKGNDSLKAAEISPSSFDLVAVRNGEPETMFDQAIAALGGMEKFVKKGQTVVVKPNIAWNRSPELGANTNPRLVKRVVEHCFKVGAKKVYLFDHSVHSEKKTYKK
ncbi:DUF362 domain-containing protein [Candidatus Auribacterota bacterium]